MGVVVKLLSETNLSYFDLSELLHEAFEEHLERGLIFTCSTMTVTQLEEKMKGGYVFVAINQEIEELIGTATIHLDNDKHGFSFGYLEFLAVKPQAKQLGVGTKLIQASTKLLLDLKAAYLLSDTACEATSSVNWHLKNGFRIYELVSYPSTDYWSYVFIKYLDGAKQKTPLQIKCHYWLSVLYFKTLRHQDGSDTALGRLYKKTKSVCRNFL